MYPNSIKSNLSLIMGHLTGIPTYDIISLQDRAQEYGKSSEFEYLKDSQEDKKLRAELQTSIYLWGASVFLNERKYSVLKDRELVELLDYLRGLIVYSCKKTLLKRRHYFAAWCLSTFTNKKALGSCTVLTAENVVDTILCKVKIYTLNGFKEYLRRFV